MIKAATDDAHARVDELPRMRRLLAPDVTRRDYGAALIRLWALYAGLASAIAPALSDLAHATLAPQDLLPALEEDLLALEISAPLVDRTPPITLSPASPAAALGAWYVLEGSALGGALIARHLRDTLGPDLPVAHFGRAARGRWPLFLAHLEDSLEDSQARDQAIVGALQAFAVTEEALST